MWGPGLWRGSILGFVGYLYEGVDLREHPEAYRVGRGEQGVFHAEPYKGELLPLWRFRTEEVARESSGAIYEKFLEYRAAGDFVGMDVARKYLQMGYTRSQRYARHEGGNKSRPRDARSGEEPDRRDLSGEVARGGGGRGVSQAQGGAPAPKRVGVSGVYLVEYGVNGKENEMRSPVLAAVLSLIVAGLGQIYNGQIGKGVIFIVLQLINGALTAVLIGWVLMPIVGLWAMIDAYLTAKRSNERYGFR